MRPLRVLPAHILPSASVYMHLIDCAGNDDWSPAIWERIVILSFSESMMLIPPPSVPAQIAESRSVRQRTILLLRSEFSVLYFFRRMPSFEYTSIPLLKKASQMLPLLSIREADTSLYDPNEQFLTSPVSVSTNMIPMCDEQRSVLLSSMEMSRKTNVGVLFISLNNLKDLSAYVYLNSLPLLPNQSPSSS